MRKQIPHLSWGRKGSWRKLFRVLAIAFFAAGLLLLSKGGNAAHSAATARTKPVQRLPLNSEQAWGKWSPEDQQISFPTTRTPFHIGQTITVPGAISLRVEEVDRNWQPQPWQRSPYPAGGQDNASGKEVILVRFTLTNLSTEPIGYSDQYFSLVRANDHEQRVAALDELTAAQYGCFGQTSPWLFPGATAHTFVPFLVNPGEQPRLFVLSWERLKPNTSKTNQPSRGYTPTVIGVARVAVALTSSQVPQATTMNSITFAPDTTFTVRSTDIYSH